MVDLPPPIDELNEYGRFAFLNEMFSMASFIMNHISDQEKNSYLKFALSAIEAERTNLRDLFKNPYQRPEAENVLALILRCAELYLQEGQWYNLCNAELQLIEKDKIKIKNVEGIKYCFQNTEFANRYVLELPIIELTFARYHMINYFEKMQEENYKGPDPDEHDPLSTVEIPIKEMPNDAELYNTSEFIDSFNPADSLFTDDDEYLKIREQYVWAAFRSFQVVGSLFTLIWYALFVIFGVLALVHENTVSMDEKAMVTSSISTGYGILMIVCELLSLRLCFCASCRPKEHIDCIYPGITMYFIQYGASWIASVLMMLSLFLYSRSSSNAINVMILQHTLAVIVPIFFNICFFKWHKRVDRKFKWIRVGFFKSCSWIAVQIIFCLILTPGIHGIQFIISTGLKNVPKISTTREKKKEGELASTD